MRRAKGYADRAHENRRHRSDDTAQGRAMNPNDPHGGRADHLPPPCPHGAGRRVRASD